jgi:hypothetical protein
MKVRNRADGCVHFTELKKFALSPAHYRAACEEPFEPSRSMRIGTGVHALVLGERAGKRVVRFEGASRRGRAWEDFRRWIDQGTEILTAPEWDAAERIAAGVLADPIAAPILARARREVPLRWDDGDIECATGGIDLLGDLEGGGVFLGDLKTTRDAEPERWRRIAIGYLYHAQLAFYRRAARSRGLDVRALYLIGVETTPPFAVTVLALSPELADLGDRSITLWLERLRRAEAEDHWPGYTQRIEPFEAPLWMADEDGEPEEDPDEDEPEEGAA